MIKKFVCNICGKIVSKQGNKCTVCSKITHGKTYSNFYCKQCGKKISMSSGLYGRGFCYQCGMVGKNHPNFGKKTNPEESFNWKGGRWKPKSGYIMIRATEHPNNRNGYILEHRLVIEKYLGRYLTKEEVVHHINGIKDDNRIENLVCLKNKSCHRKFQHLLIEEGIILDGRKLILEPEYYI